MKQQDNIMFHPAQLAMLEREFPKLVFSWDTPIERLRHHNAQQSVIEYIRSKTHAGAPPSAIPTGSG